MIEIAQLEAELATAEAERNRQYWAFTRTRRGKPVDPAITRLVYELREHLAHARSQTKKTNNARAWCAAVEADLGENDAGV